MTFSTRWSPLGSLLIKLCVRVNQYSTIKLYFKAKCYVNLLLLQKKAMLSIQNNLERFLFIIYFQFIVINFSY